MVLAHTPSQPLKTLCRMVGFIQTPTPGPLIAQNVGQKSKQLKRTNLMHFAYGRNCTEADFEGVNADMVLIDNGDSIEAFSDLIKEALRGGQGDAITLLHKDAIPPKATRMIKRKFGAVVRVHEKEPSNS